MQQGALGIQGLQEAEFAQLASENTRIIGSSKFNGTNLFTAAAGTITFQIGANNVAADDQISVVATDLTADAQLGTSGSVTAGSIATSQATAQAMITAIDTAINTVTSQRATWGAVQNRFDAVSSTLQVASENTAAARGRIMDADYATETANLSRTQILQQAGTAMLAQANQLPQNVLSLLK